MPVMLPPQSRRVFLKRAALMGAAAAFAPASQAGWFGKSRDKHTFALFSDTHIAADPAALWNKVNMADHLAACIRELAAWPVKPAALMVVGDLAFKKGLAADYATLGTLMQPVRALAPVCFCFGNHDQRENFWQAFPQDVAPGRAEFQRQCAVYGSARANWFLLDSLKATNYTPGEIGEAQFAWLDRELSARGEKPAIIVAHHYLNKINGIQGLEDSAALEALLERHPQVKAFIFGHSHFWGIQKHSTGVHLINLPPTGYAFKEGSPSGWVRCTLAPDSMEVELRALDPKHPEHGRVQTLQWRE